MDDDAQAGDLTDEQAALYWYFWDSRGRNGVPKKTQNTAQHDFKLRRAKLVALMDEIQDAGYWHIGDNGIPQFSTDQPSRPVAPWAEPGDASALVDPCVDPRPRSQKLKLLATSYGHTSSPLRGDSSIPPEGAMIRRRAWNEDVSKATVYELVDYFSYKVRKSYGGFAPDPINGDAVRAGIRRWLTADGLSPQTVRAMIEVFVTEPQFMRKGIPAWKSFLAQRQRLVNLAEDRKKRNDISSDWKRGQK